MHWKAQKQESKGLGPCEIPRAVSAGSRIAGQPGTDPQFEQCRSPTARCFPLPPQSSPESQPDPAGEVNQHFRRFAEAEIAAPAPIYGASSSIVVSMLTPFARRVISRIRCLNRSKALGAITRLTSGQIP